MDERKRQLQPWYPEHLAAIIFILGVMICLGVGGFHSFGNKIEKLRSELKEANDRIDAISRRVGSVANVNKPAGRGLWIDKTIPEQGCSLSDQLEKLERRIDSLSDQFEKLERRIDYLE